MNILIFIIFSIFYVYFFLKIYNKTNSIEGLKVSLVLLILQLVSHIGNLMSNSITMYTDMNFIKLSGYLVSDISQNWLIIVSLIIVILQYKKQS